MIHSISSLGLTCGYIENCTLTKQYYLSLSCSSCFVFRSYAFRYYSDYYSRHLPQAFDIIYSFLNDFFFDCFLPVFQFFLCFFNSTTSLFYFLKKYKTYRLRLSSDGLEKFGILITYITVVRT